MDLHEIFLISAPGLIFFLLFDLFIRKCFQVSRAQATTCMRCVLGGLDHATQAKLISRGTQKCDPKCATIPVTRFA